jgi:hypothetical protein
MIQFFCPFFIFQKTSFVLLSRLQANHCWMYKKDYVQKKSVFMKHPRNNPNTLKYPILFRYFRDIEFFLNIAKISQILENFAKIANKFLGQNFLDTILGHSQNFTDTAWIVGQLGQAKRIFHEYFLDIEFF